MRGPCGVWRDLRFEGARLGSIDAYESSWLTV